MSVSGSCIKWLQRCNAGRENGANWVDYKQQSTAKWSLSSWRWVALGTRGGCHVWRRWVTSSQSVLATWLPGEL